MYGGKMEIYEYIKLIEQQRKEEDSVYHSAAVKFGMSDTAMWILYVLSEPDSCVTQQDLCRQGSFPKQTVNTAISNMVKNGYVTLEPIPGSRNQKRILLTDAGRKLAAVTVDKLRMAEEMAYDALTAEELESYLALSKRLTDSLKKEISKL